MDLATGSSEEAFQVRQDNQNIEIEGRGYRLKIAFRQPEMALFLGNRHIATLDLASALDTVDAFDTHTGLDQPVIRENSPEKAVISWEGQSDRWDRKQIELQAWSEGFSYRYRVWGEGAIEQAYFWRNHRQGSAAQGVRLFNPEPNSRRVRYTGERCWHGSNCYVCFPQPGQNIQPDFMTISVGRDKNYHGGNWFFTPAPFCYAIEGEANWLSLGIAAEPGEWNFSDYNYPADGFGFSLNYEGHTQVKGYWQSPAMLCLVAPDEYAAIETYCQSLRADGLTPASGRGRPFPWWREPIFCGWGEQVSQEVHLGLPLASDRATQSNYEAWMEMLTQRQLNPGLVVIDDKWQSNYGLNDVDPVKWPDMAAFITGQHKLGRRVLLWLKAWDPQGVPAEECIRDSEGNPLTVDPGNPDFKKRLAGQVRYMLKEVGADGFKVDFTHLIPRGPGLEHSEALRQRGDNPADGLPERPTVTASAGGKWGLELMREWLKILSDAARAARSEAVIITHTANPYLADLVDVLRLNDVAGLQDTRASITPDMAHRARIARAASPYWLLDADNWPCSSREQLFEYITAQKDGRFGIPALYHIQLFGWGSVKEELQEEDFTIIRECWEAYRRTLGQAEEAISAL